MTPRNSTRDRRACFDAHKQTDGAGKIYLVCHICQGYIWPAQERWEAEHVTPLANGGTDVRPAHTLCHKDKTATDVREIAKGKRVVDRHYGIKRASRPMDGSKASRYKKHMDGRVSRR